MSHKATFWLASLPPEAVRASRFRVLFHLCDHHNDGCPPDEACFPSQATLMAKCGLSNGGLNKVLSQLELEGLIARKRTTIPGKRERRTYYILGCDMPEATSLIPQNGVRSDSTQVELDSEQTPLFDVSNSTFCPNKLHPSGEEPVREPVKEREDSDESLSFSNDAASNVTQHPRQEMSDAVDRFNAAADKAGWPKVQALNPTRSRSLRARLAECGGIEGWEVALRKALDSDFLCARTRSPWTGFGFDWLIKAANFTKIMEGNYDNRNRTAGPTDPGAMAGRAGAGSGGRGASLAAIAARNRFKPQD